MRNLKLLLFILAVFVVGGFWLPNNFAMATSSGPNSPGVGTNVDNGEVEWINPGNIFANDDTFADAWGTSDYLQATSFGFNIPAGATINGIIAEIEEYNTSGDTYDNTVKLVKGGVISGDNRASSDYWTSPEHYKSYGGVSDLWGLALTPDDVNASNFGVVISITTPEANNLVDHIRMTVYYTVLNTAPTGTFNSATQSTDGTGNVAVSTAINDADTNNCKAKVQYTTSATCASGLTKATLTGTPTASVSPAPDLTQGNAYQIGTTTPIKTTSANTVGFTWDSKTDLLNATGGTNYYLCLTVNDGTTDNTITASSAIAVDNTTPANVRISSITADSSTQLSVTASTATDSGSGLHATPYYFAETTGNEGASSSADYQASTNFIDTGLAPNTLYTYKVKARDAAGNVSDYSSTSSKYTLAPTPTNLQVTSKSPTQVTLSVDALNNPTSGSSGYYFYRDDNEQSHNSGWITTNTWQDTDAFECNTVYTYKIKYRNANSTETSEVSTTTQPLHCGGGTEPGPITQWSQNTEQPQPQSQQTTNQDDQEQIALMQKIIELLKQIIRILVERRGIV